MNYKLKMVILAAVLLFGVTGIALASGKLPGAVSDGNASLTGSNTQATGAAGAQYGDGQENGNAAGSQYGDDDAAGRQYGDDGATEMEDHHSAADDEYNDDMDDTGEMDNGHNSPTGNNGVGMDHENEHGNVPATTPVTGGNARSHDDENESHQSAQGGSSATTTNRNNSGMGLGSGSGSGMGRHSSSTPPTEGRD